MDDLLSARKLAITIYENQLNTTPIKEVNTSFDKLASLLERRVLRKNKLGHRAFGPYKLHTSKRDGDNVEYYSLAVADVDDGFPLENLREIIGQYAWVAYSSHNHTEDNLRYRVVMPLARDVSVEDWPRFWRGFSDFLNGHVDPATKDLSRLYFLPSCPEAHEAAAFYEVNRGAMLDPDPIIAAAPEVRKRNKKPKVANAFAAALERDYPDSYSDIVAEHCATIRWFKETGCSGNDAEPTWHKCVGVLKYCVDGVEKIHEWSSKYDEYDPVETQNKIDLWSADPTTCEVIRGCKVNYCAECTAGCRSPIQLGYTATAEPPDLSKIKEVECAPVVDKDGLVEKLWGSSVRQNSNGTLETAVDDPDDPSGVRWVKFSESVFYPYDLVRNEEGEWEVVIHYYTKYGKRREFQMPVAYLASTDKLAGALAAHTIFLTGKNGRIFAMAHLKDIILGLQHHRQEVITEEAFGWNEEGDGFIIGNVEVTAGAEKPVKLSEHVMAGGMARDYGVEGTRDDWVRLVDEVYNRPGAELYQFAFLVSAASPLISMAGIDGFHGLPVAYTGDGGRGKTTACELACSMWGKGELFKQSSNKGGSTLNAVVATTAIYRHLPFVMDELTGQDIKEVGDMFYALSNGQNKKRLGPSGTFSGKALRWDLFSFITGNMDVTGLLSTLDRQMAEAVSVRCFEIKVPDDINETVFANVNFKQLVDIELRNNYGVVGRVLLKAYMKNREKITTAIHKLRQEFQPNTADETRERFYIDLICFALVAGRIMKKLDLIRFDLDAIQKWAFSNIKALRRARTERRMTADDMAGDFISFLHDHTIITKGVADMRRGGTAEVPMDQIRTEPLARKAVSDKRFFVAAKAFQVYGKANNIAPSVVRDALDSSGYIMHITGKSDTAGGFNFRLGQGTTRTTGLSRCFELDFSKVHGLETSESDNVVSLKVAAATNPATEETTEAA